MSGQKVTATVPILQGVVADHRAIAVEAIKRECDERGLSVTGVSYMGESPRSDGYVTHAYEATVKRCPAQA